MIIKENYNGSGRQEGMAIKRLKKIINIAIWFYIYYF